MSWPHDHPKFLYDAVRASIEELTMTAETQKVTRKIGDNEIKAYWVGDVLRIDITDARE